MVLVSGRVPAVFMSGREFVSRPNLYYEKHPLPTGAVKGVMLLYLCLFYSKGSQDYTPKKNGCDRFSHFCGTWEQTDGRTVNERREVEFPWVPDSPVPSFVSSGYFWSSGNFGSSGSFMSCRSSGHFGSSGSFRLFASSGSSGYFRLSISGYNCG